MSNKYKILFIPQTDRNAVLLKRYAEGLSDTCNAIYLKTSLTISPPNIPIEFEGKIVAPPFLNPRERPKHAFVTGLRMRDFHKQFVNVMKEIGPNLVVVGVDTDGIGQWAVHIARQLGIPSLICQEGCKSVFARYRVPVSTLIKNAMLNAIFSVIYPAAVSNIVKKDFLIADYAAVWGSLDKESALRRGGRDDRITVIGDPRIGPRGVKPQYPDRYEKKLQIIYLDSGITNLPNGTVNLDLIYHFREGLLSVLMKNNCQIFYKPHPVSSQVEKGFLTELMARYKDVTFVETGAAEDYIKKMDACITFPSTAMFNALAESVPLILVDLPGLGFGKMQWNPVQNHEAGFIINDCKQVGNCLSMIRTGTWMDSYWEKSANASLDVIGFLDNNAPVRFYELVRKIIVQP